MSGIRVFPTCGDEAEGYIPQLARLRIEIFREFPYLYEGDMAYEEKYLCRYLQSTGSVIVIATDGDDVIGASTALPMSDESETFKKPFRDRHYPIEQIFYFGESVLKREYRGQGIGVQFFRQREAHAEKVGGFRYYTFCAVDRPGNHPLRPSDYRNLDEFWQHRGYQKHPELITSLDWKEIDQANENSHSMTFWVKDTQAGN